MRTRSASRVTTPVAVSMRSNPAACDTWHHSGAVGAKAICAQYGFGSRDSSRLSPDGDRHQTSVVCMLTRRATSMPSQPFGCR